MARIGTWVASQPGSAACPPAHPQASGRREVDVRRDARKAQVRPHQLSCLESGSLCSVDGKGAGKPLASRPG